MDENLGGYLLNALARDTQRAVEGHLRWDAGARRKLEQFRQALEPLAADQEDLVPSPGLRIRTLARVAEYRCRGAARVPPAPPVRPLSPISTSWWRRADVLVAASLLLICLASLLPWLARVQRKRTILECQNNLRAIYLALQGYSDHHGGVLPQVEEVPPANFAGIFIPTLYQDGVLAHVSVACPGTGRAAPTLISLDELERLSRIQPGKYAQYVREIGGCYAYPLGFCHHGGRM